MLIDEREMMNYCTVLYFATINQSVYLPAVTALSVEVYLLFLGGSHVVQWHFRWTTWGMCR
jgi:hypothetical protein